MEQFAVGFDLGKDYSQICCWNTAFSHIRVGSAGSGKIPYPYGKSGSVFEKGPAAFKALWEDS